MPFQAPYAHQTLRTDFPYTRIFRVRLLASTFPDISIKLSERSLHSAAIEIVPPTPVLMNSITISKFSGCHLLFHLLFRVVVDDTLYNASQHRTSLHAEAAQRDFHPGGHTLYIAFFRRFLQRVISFGFSLLWFKARVSDHGPEVKRKIRKMLRVLDSFRYRSQKEVKNLLIQFQ